MALLTPERIKRLLSGSTVGPPHGFDLLTPLPLPTFPRFPEPPETAPQYKNPSLAFRYLGRLGVLPSMKQMRELYRRKRGCERNCGVRNRIERKYQTAKAHLDALRARCVACDYEAVRLLITLSHVRHQLPYIFRMFWEVGIDRTARIVLCTFELPAFNSLKIYKSRNNSRAAKEVEVSSTERKRLLETIVYSLCLRFAAEPA